MTRLLITVLTCALLLPCVSGFAPASGEETVLVPFGSTMRYATFQGTHSDVPDEVYALGYDDSGWAIGTAPFGSSDDEGCPIDASTDWATGSTLVARIWVDVPPGSRDLRFLRKYVSFSGVWINGEGFSGGSNSGSPCPWAYADIVHPFQYGGGPFLIVIVHESYPWNVSWTYMDVQISVDVPSSALEARTWSMVKSLYR